MPRNEKVWNKSKVKAEPAILTYCPRCKGFGANVGDENGCHICRGRGRVWLSTSGSGWTRPLWARIQKSQLY